jgi:CubicO group peptidase (beta-lactamase class C family)
MKNRRFTLSASVLSTFVVAACIGDHAAFAQGPQASDWPTTEWQTATPEEEGMDSAALAGLVEFGTTRRFDSLLIVRHGKIVLDVYYAPYRADIPHAINSSTKAVIGTLTAIAIRDGLLDGVTHPVLDFFGDRSLANLDESKRTITVQNLLDMTSGLDWKEPLDGRPDSVIEMGRSPDWIKFVLDRPMSGAAGNVFNYNSGNPHLLSAILTKLTGMSAWDYAKAKLFGPLGIRSSMWRSDPQGNSIGGFGLALQPRDMAKLGYLYLRNGRWEDQQIVPPAWFEKVSHATVNMNASWEPELRYSNFFWALPNRHVYMAVGYHCQLIMVLPDSDLVAVTTARNFCPFGKLADYISSAVKSDSAMPPDPAGANLLERAIHAVSTEHPKHVDARPEIEAAVSGKAYKFPTNPLNVKSLSVTFVGPDPHYDLELYAPSRKLSGPIGMDGVYRKSSPATFGAAATRGNWRDDHTFAIERMTLGTGEEQMWSLSFDGAKLRLRGKDRGREVSVEGDAGN